MSGLVVGGLTPLTTTDFPGQLAAVIFCQGCPWRCGYCQNPHLIARESETSIPWPEVTDFLKRRRGLVDAVVFSGGEPTWRAGILDAVKEVGELGFKIGLHTGGPYPRRLEKLLPLIDWVGMDVKAALNGYERITNTPGSGIKALDSARLILDAGLAYEFRTTVHPTLISREELLELASGLARMGARHYALQEFRPTGCANPDLIKSGQSGYLDEEFCNAVGAMFETFAVRRA